jgi:hypothetical protein
MPLRAADFESDATPFQETSRASKWASGKDFTSTGGGTETGLV